MSDHVEALQLDLASIKEFLTSNSFNQIDPYTISNVSGLETTTTNTTTGQAPLADHSDNTGLTGSLLFKLFSPLGLDSVENDSFYLEPPLPTLSSVDKLKQIGPAALESIIPSVLETGGGPLDSGAAGGGDLTNGRLLNGNHHHHQYHHPYHHLNHYSSSYNNNSFGGGSTTNNNNAWKLI